MPTRLITPSAHKGFPLPGALNQNSRLLDIQAVREALITIDEQLNLIGSEVSIINTDTLAVKNNIYVFTASLILTLPLDPIKNDKVTFSNRSNTLTSTIGMNGSKIMGLDENLSVNTLNGNGTLVYTDAVNGWVLI